MVLADTIPVLHSKKQKNNLKKLLFRFLKRNNKEDKLFKNKLSYILGFNPSDVELYKTALRHSSASINNQKKKINNERLEFVGDAVLSMVIADVLYTENPQNDEGSLSLLRSKIVCRKNLNDVAIHINLHKLLICKNQGPFNTNNISGNALEAIFGAIYYDKGYMFCKKFAKKILLTKENSSSIINCQEDYKSQLYNFAQKHKLNICFNTFENCEANEKIQHFFCELFINENYLTCGKGWSKKEAEQNCAKEALNIPQKTVFKISRQS